MTKCFSVLVLALAALFISSAAHAVTFHFAFIDSSDVAKWETSNWGYGEPTLSHSAFSGGCLQAATSASGYAKFYLGGNLPDPGIDLTSEPRYKLDVYVPTDIVSPQAQLSVKTGSLGDRKDAGAFSDLTPGAWNVLTWDMAEKSWLSDVRQLGVQIQGTFPGTAITFNLDNATTSPPVPEPASLLLLGAGLVGLFGFMKKKKA